MTSEPATIPRVFLSYASPDLALAQKLCAALEGGGQPCWIAPRDVRPGEAYAAAIVQAIAACRALVLLLSAHSAASPHVLREVERASSKHRPVLAIRLDGTALPPELEYFLSSTQWLDASGTSLDAVLPALLGALRGPGSTSDVGPVAAAPAPPRRSVWRSWPALAGLAALAVLLVAADRVWIAHHGAAPQGATALVPPAAIPDLPVVPTTPEKSIAVLPFADLSEKRDQEYFADGLAEDLIDQLTRVPGLAVPARTSSFHFKGQTATVAEIAAALSVTYVLEGTMRKAGNTLRVRAELIRAADGINVWSATYDRDLRDIFRVQDDIAGRVAAALQLALPGALPGDADRSASSEAYNQFLLGRHFFDQYTDAGFHHAIDAFHEAIRLDPKYVSAWAGLAAAEAALGDRVGDPDGITRGLADAEEAIRLAPDAASGYAARGRIRVSFLWDWAGAAADYDRVQALDTTGRYDVGRAFLAEALGNAPEAIRLLELAVRQDPLSASHWASLSDQLIQAGRIDEGRAAAHRALDIEPDLPEARLNLALASLLGGHADEALPDAQAVGVDVRRLTGVALAQHSLGNEPESQRALDALIKGYAAGGAYQIAEVQAWRGDRDQAFAWLDRAVAQRDGGLSNLKLDPLMASLRADPRYAALLRRLKLPP